MTKEQDTLIEIFGRKHFEIVPGSKSPVNSVAEFLQKTEVEKTEVIKTFASKHKSDLEELKTKLNDQLGRVNAELTIVDKAISDWSK